MTSALRYEWRRITTVRSTWIMAALAVLVVVAFAALIASFTDTGAGFSPEGDPMTTPGTLAMFVNAFVVQLAAVFLSVVAAQAIGQDYRHGMIRLTLSAFPRRSRILAAKLIMVLLTTLVVGAVAFLLAALVMLLIDQPPVDMTAVHIMLKGLAILMLYCTIAFALTILTRILALGVIIPVVVALVVEQILVAISFLTEREWVARLLPFQRAFGDLSWDGGWSGIGILAAWAVGLMAVAWVVFKRRDA